MLVTIQDEPEGSSYEALLRFAEANSEYFSLVWREQLVFDHDAAALEQALRTHLVEERVTDAWPGTKLFGHRATLRFYRPARAAIAVLGQAGSLYSWLAPARPEDLAFYTASRVPWLFTIAHERDGAIDSTAIDLALLQTAVPALRLALGEAAAG